MQKTKVRRRVLACARCRKRKLSCDGEVPVCGRCSDADVPCVGFDSGTQKEAPRSIADHLEQRIASLNDPSSPTSVRGHDWQNIGGPSPYASPASNIDSVTSLGEDCTYADALVNKAMEDITPTFLGITKLRPILSCVVKGTQPPSRKGLFGPKDLDVNHSRSILNPQPSANTLDGIDHKVAHGLFHNYLDHVITQYPIYHRNDVTAAFNSIYFPASNPGHDSPRNRYIVSIIMAISLSTAAQTKQKMANDLAYLLVRQAMQYIPEVATNDISGLQAILLLTQYIFLNPSVADLWLLTGLISQAVIDLGLHQELPKDLRISAYQRDMRRRLFWCAWEMEVGVCCIFQRPVNLPIRDIDVEFPAEVDDVFVTQNGIDLTGRVSKFTFRRLCLFRIIEAEIFAVMQHGEPIAKEYKDMGHWMQSREDEILEWQREIHTAAQANEDRNLEERWKEMSLYSDITVSYLRVALNRPSPANPKPSTRQLMVAFYNTVLVAEGYFQQSNTEFGRIKYVFHPCHHVFNCANVFLRILQRCKQEVSMNFVWPDIEYWMGRFSICFLAIAERWTVARRCLEDYERELVGIKREYVDFLEQRMRDEPRLPPTPMSNPAEALDSNPQPDTAEALDFREVFNSPTTVDTTDTLPTDVPIDWTAAFDLKFGPMPDPVQYFIPSPHVPSPQT